MSDPIPSNSLSEIGHLFLSSVRDKHTNGAPRPVRRPPGSAPISESVTAVPSTEESIAQSDEPELVIPPVTAVIAAHLGASQLDRSIEYARHLARDGQRIGLVEVDGSVFRLMCFDCPPQGPEEFGNEEAREFFDARAMAAAIDELSWDLDRWLLVLPNPRGAESRQLLRHCQHWALLSTCDHDGVVSAYRQLKWLAESERPRLSLALLDARDDAEADQVHRKIAGVCEQFLGWSLEAELPVLPCPDVAGHNVMLCQPTRSKAELAMAPQWQVVCDFLARAKEDATHRTATDETEGESEGDMNETFDDINALNGFDSGRAAISPESPTAAFAAAYATGSGKGGARADATPTLPLTPIPAASPLPEPAVSDGYAAPLPLWPRPAEAAPAAADIVADVIDLPDASASAGSILSAVLRNANSGMVECPVTPPMCPEARLAVSRDRGLVLLAVARQGLAELRAVGRAYAWVVENIALIRMAVPQLSVDTNRAPRLRLLVDHADLTADVLQPMLRSETVTVQAYRRLRWGSKTGLLLEAA